MRTPRRGFLQKSGVLAAALITGNATHGSPVRPVFTLCRSSSAVTLATAAEETGVVPPQLDLEALEPFVDALPRPPIARPDSTRPSPENPAIKLPYYRIALRATQVQIHRDLRPTAMWGYGSTSPGPIIETGSGAGLFVEWVNELPPKHFLPIDHSLHGAEEDQPEVRVATHVHGARVPPESDGYPEHWIVPGQSALCYYPNRQDGATLWYHDHAMGITRLNIYAGLYGLFVIRDGVEDALDLPAGSQEIPLILCDRLFDQRAQLYYPLSPKPGARWMPELLGDATLVNGKLLPYLEVEARSYRFRVLNASNSRLYYLSLSSRQPFEQIGSDQGLLSSPVVVKALALAAGERADLIVDFSKAHGQTVLLMNDAVALMQFRVAGDAAHDTGSAPNALREVRRTPEAEAVRTRVLTLDENRDPAGNSMSLLLNATPWAAPVTEKAVIDTVEIWSLVNLTDDIHPIHLHLVRFQILDRRRFDVFAYQNTQELRYTGEPIPPAPNEAGWKDTVRANPKTVTRIIVRFEGYVGRYVWHCHVLEHEDNEMMRPYEVVREG